MHEPAAGELASKLAGWATYIAARYSGPVYLVGSALELPNPRDVDIRCVIDDELFIARFGDFKQWYHFSPSINNDFIKYAAEIWDISREAALQFKINIDFAVQPITVAKEHQKSRMRIDYLYPKV
jgi:hypothetical protein